MSISPKINLSPTPGYQGPNSWLNPEYNQAKDIERYKAMRASQLGLSEKELYNYFTKDQQMPEYVQASAMAGTALHLVEEAKATKSGRVKAAEELAYDPNNSITGHIDITYKSGAPADIKTVSSIGFKNIQKSGIKEKHKHQLNWYMNQKNAKEGFIEYINRDDTSQRTTIQLDYSEKMHQSDMAKLARVRSRVTDEINSGKLNESNLPKSADIQRLREAQAQEAGEMAKWQTKIPYLEDIFEEQMDYVNKVRAKDKAYKASKDQYRKGRMKRFAHQSKKAVGIGHRAAHNAGRRHSGFSSTQSA